MLNTLYLIFLISLEDFGMASILLIACFLCFCIGVYESMYGDNKEQGSTYAAGGFIGMAIMAYYYYTSYNLSDPRVFYEWAIYFNFKAAIGL